MNSQSKWVYLLPRYCLALLTGFLLVIINLLSLLLLLLSLFKLLSCSTIDGLKMAARVLHLLHSESGAALHVLCSKLCLAILFQLCQSYIQGLGDKDTTIHLSHSFSCLLWRGEAHKSKPCTTQKQITLNINLESDNPVNSTKSVVGILVNTCHQTYCREHFIKHLNVCISTCNNTLVNGSHKRIMSNEDNIIALHTTTKMLLNQRQHKDTFTISRKTTASRTIKG